MCLRELYTTYTKEKSLENGGSFQQSRNKIAYNGRGKKAQEIIGLAVFLSSILPQNTSTTCPDEKKTLVPGIDKQRFINSLSLKKALKSGMLCCLPPSLL